MSETEKFLQLAEQAYFYTKARYGWFNDTIIEKDDLINHAWLTGNYKKDIDKNDYFIIRTISNDMIHFLIHERFGRTCRQYGKQRYREKITCQYLEEVGSVTQGWFSEVVFDNPVSRVEQQDTVDNIMKKIPIKNRIRLAMTAVGYSGEEIGKRLGVTGQAVRYSMEKTIKHLQEVM